MNVLMCLKDFLLLQLLLSTKNLTSGELKTRNSSNFCLTKKFYVFESIETHDLIYNARNSIPEFTHAHSHYFNLHAFYSNKSLEI